VVQLSLSLSRSPSNLWPLIHIYPSSSVSPTSATDQIAAKGQLAAKNKLAAKNQLAARNELLQGTNFCKEPCQESFDSGSYSSCQQLLELYLLRKKAILR
jgi:hypothetical protein